MHFGLFGRWTALGMHFGWEWTLTRGKDWVAGNGDPEWAGKGIKGPQFDNLMMFLAFFGHFQHENFPMQGMPDLLKTLVVTSGFRCKVYFIIFTKNSMESKDV